MCVRIHRSTLPAAPWDADRNLITIPEQLNDERTLRAIRAILDGLAAPQPEHGAVCWCGSPIRVGPHVPAQRTSEVMARGA